MKKVKDITSLSFELLKYDKSQWGPLWRDIVFSKAPTLFSLYLRENESDFNTVTTFYDTLGRREYDSLYWRYNEFSEQIRLILFESAGKIYRQSVADFGIFLSVGIKRNTFSFFRTKKGTVMFIDIWFLLGVNHEKKLGKIFQVDEITTLFTCNYQRIQSGIE
ncbi:MAG: hypothetical protein U9N62_01865 [Thermotogota bacterium]|nr:hypothetical protein [Thermotogota bacterium]